MAALWHAASPEEKENMVAAYMTNIADVAANSNAGYGFTD
jgi:hypothetical protein